MFANFTVISERNIVYYRLAVNFSSSCFLHEYHVISDEINTQLSSHLVFALPESIFPNGFSL